MILNFDYCQLKTDNSTHLLFIWVNKNSPYTSQNREQLVLKHLQEKVSTEAYLLSTIYLVLYKC